MFKLLLFITTVMLFTQVAAAASKNVTCEIFSDNKQVFKGKCIFVPDQGGSFSLSGIGGKPLFEGVTDVSVTLIDKGIAEVRGLTTDGINSRWGEATRSKKDKACWTGDDFKVCAR